MPRLHAFVVGKVQGVFYRAGVRQLAERLGLKGWVRNCSDGRVEILAEGPADKLETLQAWCRHGPPGAAVSAFQTIAETPTGEFSGFHIRSRG